MRVRGTRIVAWLLAIAAVFGFVAMAIAGVPGAVEVLVTAGAIVGLIFAGGRLHGLGRDGQHP